MATRQKESMSLIDKNSAKGVYEAGMGRFQFANVVVVDDDQIGVIVKAWGDCSYEVYVRSYNAIRTYKSKDIQRYIYSKVLHEDEYQFYE